MFWILRFLFFSIVAFDMPHVLDTCLLVFGFSSQKAVWWKLLELKASLIYVPQGHLWIKTTDLSNHKSCISNTASAVPNHTKIASVFGEIKPNLSCCHFNQTKGLAVLIFITTVGAFPHAPRTEMMFTNVTTLPGSDPMLPLLMKVIHCHRFKLIDSRLPALNIFLSPLCIET